MESVVGEEPVYNEAEAVRLNGELKLEVLDGALNAVIAPPRKSAHELSHDRQRTRGGRP